MTRFWLHPAFLLTQAVCFQTAAPAAIVYAEGFGQQYGYGWPDRGVYVQDIDLDGDGAYDYYFQGGGIDFVLVPTAENRILSLRAAPPDLQRVVVPMSEGAVIGVDAENGTWMGNADAINQYDYGPVVIHMVNGHISSTIPEDEVRYLGLEYHRDDGVHYGWLAIRSGLIHNYWVDVLGWAWESEPGKPILAGTIPEPSGVALAALAAGTLALRRKRRGG